LIGEYVEGELRDNLHVLGSALALRDLGANLKPILNASDLPFGANMAMRRNALRPSPFDPTLGRIGTALLSGEETAVFEQVLAAGLTGYWIGGAKVRHLVPPERMTLAFIRGYFAGIGQTDTLRANATERQRLSRKIKSWRRRLPLEKLRLRLTRRRDADWARAVVSSALREGRLAALTAKPA